MQRFKNILVIVDDQGTAALNEAVILARATRAKLTVASVLENGLGKLPWTRGSITSGGLLENLVRARAEALEQLVTAVREDDISIALKVMVGVPFVEITRQVIREDHDLVMITPDEVSMPKRLIFGSTMAHLMYKLPCPVWVIKPRSVGSFARIMAVIDPLPAWPADPVQDPLNRNVLQVASSLARINRSKLHIVHTWRLFGENILRGRRFNMSSAEIDHVLRGMELERRVQLGRLLANHDLHDIEDYVHFAKGHASSLIPMMADEYKIDLIVMGILSQTRVEGLILGDTTEAVIRQGDASVIALKRDRFVSPVKLDEQTIRRDVK